MFGSAILDVGIGLVVIYIVFSLVGSTITEAIAQTLNMRGKNLVIGIKHLLDDPNSDLKNLEARFMDHPLIKGLDYSLLGKNNKVFPDYISSETFTTVVSDLLEIPQKTREAGDDLGEALASLPDGNIKVSLTALLNAAKGKVDDFENRVADWYDEAMDRVSALYKRKAHLITFLVALTLVLVFNVDTLHYGNTLYENTNLRQNLASIGEQMVAEEKVGELNELLEKVDAANLPIGWTKAQWDQTLETPGAILTKLLGFLISIFAISLGGPFWFQVLNKMVNLKSGGIPPPTAEEKELLRKHQQSSNA